MENIRYARWFKEFHENSEDNEEMVILKVDLGGLELSKDNETEDMSQWSSEFNEGEFGEGYIYSGGVVSPDRIEVFE